VIQACHRPKWLQAHPGEWYVAGTRGCARRSSRRLVDASPQATITNPRLVVSAALRSASAKTSGVAAEREPPQNSAATPTPIAKLTVVFREKTPDGAEGEK